MNMDIYVQNKIIQLSAKINSISKNLEELSNLLNINASDSSNNIIRTDKLIIDKNDYTLRFNDYDACIKLTHIRFCIIQYLTANKGKICSSKELYRYIYDEESYNYEDSIIPVHISRIRKDIRELIGENNIIRTIKRVGYVID